MRDITLGADPEMFIYNTKTKEVVSAIGIIPGEKDNAWRDSSWKPGFGVEIDNILAEFNIPACKKEKEWVDNINFMKNKIRDMVKIVNPDFDILCTASMDVPEKELQHPIARILGWIAAA